MPKVKPKRKVPSIDMTAMVDVAFLLLTFFILTTKFKAEEKVAVDPPSAESAFSQDSLNTSGLMTLTIDEEGRVFFGLPTQFHREEVLGLIMQDYGVQVSEDGMNYFRNQTSVGVPFFVLSSWLSGNKHDIKEFPEEILKVGIPVNAEDIGRIHSELQGKMDPTALNAWLKSVQQPTKQNELNKWLTYAKIAHYNLTSSEKVEKRPFTVVVKGARDAEYTKIDKVVSTLQDLNVNRFYLLTNLEKGGS